MAEGEEEREEEAVGEIEEEEREEEEESLLLVENKDIESGGIVTIDNVILGENKREYFTIINKFGLFFI